VRKGDEKPARRGDCRCRLRNPRVGRLAGDGSAILGEEEGWGCLVICEVLRWAVGRGREGIRSLCCEWGRILKIRCFGLNLVRLNWVGLDWIDYCS
jgi:hypothetical protein